MKIILFCLVFGILPSVFAAKDTTLKFPFQAVRLPGDFRVSPMPSTNSFFAESEKSQVTITRREFPLKNPSEKMVRLMWAQNLEAVGEKSSDKECKKGKKFVECRRDKDNEMIRMRVGLRSILVVHQKSKSGTIDKSEIVAVEETR